MKVCQVFHRDYPWDIRVQKISKALIEAGNEVHLVCNNTRMESSEGLEDGIHIHRLPAFLGRKINRVVSVPLFFNPYWIAHFFRIAERHRFDIIVVRDLPLVVTAWLVSSQFKTPIVYDMAENFPAMLDNFRSIMKSPFWARHLENVALKIVDHVIVVVEESKERIRRKGVSEDRISIIGNTPDLRIFEKSIDEHEISVLNRGCFNILYVGYITPLRGLDVVIKALPKVAARVYNVKLSIIGDGDDLGRLRTLALEEGANEYVDLLGWVDFRFVPYLISECDVGIIPHCANEHTNTTIPNKLFDYMACGKPVIVSDVRPLRRIVESVGCGVVFRAGSSNDFCAKVMDLMEKKKREDMGEKGRNAVEERYNWEEDSRRLLEALKKVVSRRGDAED